MKLSQKTKYVIYGVIATTLAVPLVVIAESTINLTFKDGDVISANVMNQIFSRINNVVTGFTTPAELDGTWTCTTYGGVPAMVGTECASVPGRPMLSSKVGTVTYTSATNTFSYTGVGPIGSCMSTLAPPSSTITGGYDVISNHLLGGGVVGGVPAKLTKISPSQFSLEGTSFVECSKANPVPAPANNLTGTATGTSVALTWVDQSTNETGFRVESKASLTGAWTAVTTTAANATSYTYTATAGTYWFRVIASNATGDASSSNEIQVVVQ